MTIRIGDKVRFLNEVGGGIVSGFRNKEVVLVEDEDGFEIPILAKECVVIEAAEGPGISTTCVPGVNPTKNPITNTNKEKKIFQAFLALVPEFEDAPLQGKLELFLINDSPYFFYYLCEENGSKRKAFADGLLHPDTHQALGHFSAQQLGEIGKMKLRLLPFKREQSYEPHSLVEKTVSFHAVKLSKSSAYEDTPHLGFKAHLIPLHQNPEKEVAENFPQKEKHSSPKSRLKSPKKEHEVIEVDLHIEALLDSISGMTKSEMLDYQLRKFESILNENKGRKGQRIIFIHGVGNGRLKADIRRALQGRPHLDFQDASFREYGYGATMVIIR